MLVYLEIATLLLVVHHKVINFLFGGSVLFKLKVLSEFIGGYEQACG